MNVKDTIRLLKSEKASALMAELYGREGAAENETRYEKVLTGFEQTFGDRENILLFSSPGRTEISGNHTDHNHGRYLQAALPGLRRCICWLIILIWSISSAKPMIRISPLI